MDDGCQPTVLSTTELTVANPMNYYVGDNQECIIDVNGNTWDITAVALIDETVETDEQVTGTILQHKTRALRVNRAGDESDWATWHTGTECT
jgi:hypothetical protein